MTKGKREVYSAGERELLRDAYGDNGGQSRHARQDLPLPGEDGCFRLRAEPGNMHHCQMIRSHADVFMQQAIEAFGQEAGFFFLKQETAYEILMTPSIVRMEDAA